VKAYIEKGNCVFQVKDTGIGMPQSMKDKILELGSDSTRMGTNDEKGTGLGLMLCKEMVDKHSGSFEIESTEGEGSVFTISLPLNLTESDPSES
jgi:signal transduction histidine kinase